MFASTDRTRRLDRIDRVDTDALKRQHPVAEVVARYGVELRPSGRALVGRCPFHADGGRPNLHVYPRTESWYCYRCSVGGDVISFVERIERVDFRAALLRLNGSLAGRPGWRPSIPGTSSSVCRARPRLPAPFSTERRSPGPDERACLAAAVELYHNALLSDEAGLAYVTGRGIDQATLERFQVGYVRGDELLPYLRWRRLPVGAARRVGLLGRSGEESLAGRVVFPEVRRGQPVWLIGRLISEPLAGPKYLGLPGPKPLLGWERAKGSREVFLVEGVFDLLVLAAWGYPTLALAGSRARAAQVEILRRFARVYLVLDSDPAGAAGTLTLQQELGERAVAVRLPGVKDVAELAVRAGGREAFHAALRWTARKEAA